jgi:hypothetical protein
MGRDGNSKSNIVNAYHSIRSTVKYKLYGRQFFLVKSGTIIKKMMQANLYVLGNRFRF